MSGPKRNPDKLNSIGVVVVGICGAVLVYVTIVALQAFYMDDTSEIQTMADYGGQDTDYQSLRSEQNKHITEPGPNAAIGGKQTYRIPIDVAMKLVAKEAKADPAFLVPTQGRSDQPTALPIYGRPKEIPSAGAGSAGSAADAGSGAAGSGSAVDAPSVTPTPTGGQGQGGGPPKGTQGRPVKNPGAPATGTPPKGNGR
ncbi:MAG TPA: hypothetical protein VIU61_22840 [Kofleriaceae bacterium]